MYIAKRSFPLKLPIALPDNIRAGLLSNQVISAAWGTFRRRELHKQYYRRREHYAAVCAERQIAYRPDRVHTMVMESLRRRGYSAPVRKEGDIHTFAFFPNIGWHKELLPDLRELGPVTYFDYVSHGFRPSEIYRATAAGIQDRKALNVLALQHLKEVHSRKPVDWVFMYASGYEISAGTIRRIKEDLGIPTVNMCLDDKQSWAGSWVGDHRGGQIDIAAEFDLSWTSSRLACDWYLAEGGCPIYLPEGFASENEPAETTGQTFNVSFVGGAYGLRPGVIRFLRKHGVNVEVFGRGWPSSTWTDDIRSVFRHSIINLGIGAIDFSDSLTNVKGRDFEIPAIGGGVYLTTFNSDLAQHYVIGSEILCYRSLDELLELTRYYLKHQDESRDIAVRGRLRCYREHRWLNRYQTICSALGILRAEGSISRAMQ